MLGLDDAVASATTLINTAINKIWPDKTEEANAQANLIRATAEAAIAQMAQAMSVMLAEAQSPDPWTSRARPSFLYVMYIMILFALPMGVLGAFRPDLSAAIAEGMRAWLSAIPDGLWATFGIGYSGYAISRSYEKVKGVGR